MNAKVSVLKFAPELRNLKMSECRYFFFVLSPNSLHKCSQTSCVNSGFFATQCKPFLLLNSDVRLKGRRQRSVTSHVLVLELQSDNATYIVFL